MKIELCIWCDNIFWNAPKVQTPAAAVLGTPLIVVLGHQRCGAVAAACDVVAKNATFPGSIGPMIDPILPAAIAMRGKPGDFLDSTIRENARRSAT
jgi:carbonic anhydrase